MSFDSAFEAVVGVEGKYSNDPNDAGGETMYGITNRTAEAYGYKDDMKLMPLTVAKIIYKRMYWDALNLDKVDVVSKYVAHELFDTGVNCGIGTAATFLQRCLNVLNRMGKDYGDIKVDGSLGMGTVAALTAYMQKRGVEGEGVLLKALNSLQGAYYIALAEKRETDESFEYGWLKNRA